MGWEGPHIVGAGKLLWLLTGTVKGGQEHGGSVLELHCHLVNTWATNTSNVLQVCCQLPAEKI